MAGTLQINLSANLTHGTLRESFNPGGQTITQTTAGQDSGIQVVGTSEESVAATDVSTLGWAFFQNLDATNYIEIGPDSGGTMVGFIRLEPGEACALRLKPGITVKAQANTAAVKLKYLILED